MTLRRLTVFVTVAAVILTVVVATTGFGGGTMERGVTIAFGDDEDAYVGINSHSPITAPSGQSTVSILTIQNNFNGDIRIRVDATVESTPTATASPRLQSVNSPAVLGIGEAGPIQAVVQCDGDSSATGTFTIAIQIDGPDVSSSFVRDVTVTCSGNHSTQPTTTPASID